MVQLLEKLPADDLLAVYPNAGYPRYTAGHYLYPTAPDYLANAAREMAAQGARLIGGCCGTTPAHIAAVAKAIVDLKPVPSKSVRVIAEALRAPLRIERAPADSARSVNQTRISERWSSRDQNRPGRRQNV